MQTQLHFPPHNGIDTSILAAARVSSRSHQDEARLLAFIKERGATGATDCEICERFGWNGDYERPRRWKWSKDGVIVRSNTKRPTSTGSLARAWVAA